MSRAKNTGQKRGWGTDLGLRDGSADPLSHAVTMRRQSTLDMVNDALARKQAVLAYQPIVQAGNFGHVAFYEGLVRILDQTGRPIPAKDFMSEVEDTETGRKIDCLALELGLGALIADPALRLSINMSARSIGYSPWMKVLQDGVATNDTVAERLILEISEPSAMSMPEVVAAFMADVQRLGVSFALDDFGSGTTSFRHLQSFFFDILKIDGRFCNGLTENGDNQVMAATLIQIGHNLDMFTVASKVEDEMDAQSLAALGVDCLQGFYFGAPTLKIPERDPGTGSARRQA